MRDVVIDKKYDPLYMDLAKRVAQESYCERKKVGCVVVTPLGVSLVGYNGTVKGLPNVCELANGETDPNVLHAETNAFSKALMAGVSTLGSTLYVTLMPCLMCSKTAIQAGVKRVVYLEEYRCTKGVDLLRTCGIMVEQYTE